MEKWLCAFSVLGVVAADKGCTLQSTKSAYIVPKELECKIKVVKL